MTAPHAVPLPEAVARLAAPDALEVPGGLGGEPLLVVDLAAGPPRAPGVSLARARAALAALPRPSVALGPPGEVAPAAAAWSTLFDVVAEGPRELEAVADGVARAPLAALVLVQLLRAGARGAPDLETGLLAESLAYSTLQAGPEFAAWLARRPARRPPAPPRADAPPVRVRRDGARLRITLDRPERRNAYSAAMRDALLEALALAAADETLREIVLDGAGPAFSSGGDLDEFGTFPDPAAAHAVRSARSAARLLAACAGRLRAELHGACVGAGIELPAFAQRVVAREDAFFELPEVAMGLVPGAGGTVSLPRRIGRQRTAWLALSGARIDAATARAWGLVDELLPTGEPPRG